MLRNVHWLRSLASQLRDRIAALTADHRGVSSIEFSLFVGMVSFGMLNVVDVSRYIYQKMEVENATQMGAQAIWKTCDPSKGYLPATTSCPGLTNIITSAVQSTSLGSNVSLQTGTPTEGYYCVNGSGALQYMSDVSSPPTDCSNAGMPGVQPGDYIQVATAFSYTPLFKGVTVTGTLPTQITKTAMIRLN